MKQINVFELMCEPYKIKMPIRLIECFAGIGSQAKALERLGVNFEHHKVVEFDKYAIQSYNAIHGTNFETSDITKIYAEDLEITETDKFTYLLTYSFPCQDLSLAGKQRGMEKGSGTRSGLLWEVERLLDECIELNGNLPQVLLMENVPEVIGAKNIEHFKQWRRKLETLGYSNYCEVLNAKDFGIPQNRKRCFMVSILGDYYYEFPKPFKLELRLKDLLENEVDEKYYLTDEQLTKGYFGNALNPNLKDHYDRKKAIINKEISYPLSTKADRRIGDCNYVTDEIKEITVEEFLKNKKAFLTIPKKTKRGFKEAYEGDGVYINRPHQKRGCVQDKMIQTLKTSCNDIGVVTNLRVRKLTPLEFFRLMGFDDEDFYKAQKVNSNTQLYKQAGNSIVVNVLEEIFKQLF